MARKTAVINQIRAFLLERGVVFARSPIRLRERMPDVLENADENLTPRMRNLLSCLWEEWKDLEQQLHLLNLEVEQIASTDAARTQRGIVVWASFRPRSTIISTRSRKLTYIADTSGHKG